MAIDQKAFEHAFRVESFDLLEQAENCALKLEKGTDAETVNQLFRAVHTIKGNSGIVKATAVTDLSHALETLLNLLRKTGAVVDSAQVDLILQCCDRLREMIRDLPNAGGYDNKDLIARLQTASGERGGNGRHHSQDSSASSSRLRLTRTPAGLLAGARDRNRFLSFVSFDPLRSSLSTLHQVRGFLDRVSDHGSVLKPGTRIVGEALFLYFFLESEEDPTVVIGSCGGPVDSVQIVHSPVKGAAPVVPASVSSAAPSAAPTPAAAKGSTPSPSAAPGSSPAPAASAPADEYLKIPTILADDLINASGESIVARNELMMRVAKLGDRELEAAAKKISRLISYLQDRIMRVRLQKIDSVFSRLPRLVRDTCMATGKEADLVLTGGEVELDKNLIAAVSDPLTHILRNAIDHGIESAEVRASRGKSARGRVAVSASLAGGNVTIAVEDDGKGLDLERLRAKAVERGILSPEIAAAAPPDQIYDLIFLPGFSTADRITETSGRGVGMDVVRSNVQQMGGRVEIESRPGLGCTFRISLPQTITIVNCLLAGVGSSKFAIAQKEVEEVLRVDPTLLSRVEKGAVYDLRGRILPVINLKESLGLADSGKERYLIVMQTDRYRYGVLFDRIYDQQEFVLKPLGEYFADLQHFAGAGVLGDGEVVMIFDADFLGRKCGLDARVKERVSDQKRTDEAAARRIAYFLFELHGQQYAIPARFKPGLRRLQTGDVFFQVDQESVQEDGNIIPVIRLDRYFGGEMKPDGKRMFALTLRSGTSRVALLATRIVALVAGEVDISATSAVTPGILGEGLIQGRPTAFIDVDAVVRHQVAERFHGTAVTPRVAPPGGTDVHG